MNEAETKWFGLRVRSHCEFQANQDLQARGFETFLPLYSSKRRWSDRIKVLQLPLFPGYLFCRFPIAERIRILNANGVVQILGTGKNPIPVPEEEIHSVKVLIDSHASLAPHPYLAVGQHICIKEGPLCGLEGTILQSENGKAKVVVSVDMFLRSVAAEVDRAWLCGMNRPFAEHTYRITAQAS